MQDNNRNNNNQNDIHPGDGPALNQRGVLIQEKEEDGSNDDNSSRHVVRKVRRLLQACSSNSSGGGGPSAATSHVKTEELQAFAGIYFGRNQGDPRNSSSLHNSSSTSSGTSTSGNLSSSTSRIMGADRADEAPNHSQCSNGTGRTIHNDVSLSSSSCSHKSKKKKKKKKTQCKERPSWEETSSSGISTMTGNSSKPKLATVQKQRYDGKPTIPMHDDAQPPTPQIALLTYANLHRHEEEQNEEHYTAATTTLMAATQRTTQENIEEEEDEEEESLASASCLRIHHPLHSSSSPADEDDLYSTSAGPSDPDPFSDASSLASSDFTIRSSSSSFSKTNIHTQKPFKRRKVSS